MREDPWRHDRLVKSSVSTLAVALRLLRADGARDVERDPRSWPRWVALLPHVPAVTAYLGRQEAPAAGMLDDASWLLDWAGIYLHVYRPVE